MAQFPQSMDKTPPYWSQVLRALREARGITQDGWAAQLGYGRATVRRWESGATVPSAGAEAEIVALCHEKRLFRRFDDGPLAGIDVTPEWIADVLAAARLRPDAPSPPSRPDEPPPVRYALSGDVSIAYQMLGDGPIDIVVTPGAVSHRELDWEHPGAVAFYRALARIGRVIVFDKRGTGMSDRVPAGSLEDRMDDIRAVMDAAGAERAVLVGVSEGGPMSILCAATHQRRITALVLYGAYSHVPAAMPETADAQRERLLSSWGTTGSSFLERFGPSAAGDPDARAWWARYQRISASPGSVLDLNRMNAGIDVREVLPAIHIPTLVLHRTGDRAVDLAEGHQLARDIAGARFIELPGEDHLPWLGAVDDITGAITEFLASLRQPREVDRVLATVLCVAVHDAGSARFVAMARQEFSRWRGQEMVGHDADVLATFDGPTRAVRCARALLDRARTMGVMPRIGIHTGEIEAAGVRISGATVDHARTLATRAAPGTVLVSGTVTDLVSDPGVAFQGPDIDPGTTIRGSSRTFRMTDGPGRTGQPYT